MTAAYISFKSWFAVPRNIMRQNLDEPVTPFDRIAPPEMRLYLHLLKRRRNRDTHTEANNADLMGLLGIDKHALRRARQKLVDAKVISCAPTDKRHERYRYEFCEYSSDPIPLPLEQQTESLPNLVAVPFDPMPFLNTVPSLEGRKGKRAATA